MCVATATTTKMIQTRPPRSSKPPSIFKKTFILSPISVYALRNGFHEHPESQHGGDAVKGVPEYCAGAPRFLFLTEHARHYADDSDQLKNTQGYGANPPPHV